MLDGVNVETEEVAAARDLYTGRLNADFLEEKLGNRNFNRMKLM